MLAVGGEKLKGRPAYQKGTRVRRISDGKVFPVEVGKNAETGEETNILGCIKDGDSSFVCGVGGSLLEGWELADQPKGSTPATPNQRLGNVIRSRRVQLGLSQEALANRVGVTFQQVQKYEKGRNQVGFTMLVDLAAALETTVAGLVAKALGEGKADSTGGSDRQMLEHTKRLGLLSPNQREGVQLLVRKLAEGL